MKINEKISQYGLLNSIRRSIKKVFRKIGVDYDSFWYLYYVIDFTDLKKKMSHYSYNDVKELRQNDFDHINEKKIKIVRDRFNSGKFFCYGIVHNKKTVYTTWVNISHIGFPTRFKKILPLDEDEGFLEDSYCNPLFRGKKFHSKMNLYRLMKLHELNKRKVGGLVLTENIPAFKSLFNIGFKKKKKISCINIFGKLFYFEKHIDG